MKNRLSFCLLIFFLLIGGGRTSLYAQEFAVKTNALYDATATVNVGAEIGVAPKWTIDISGNYNGWSKDQDVKWKHVMLQPEVRYWFCDRFSGHFVGAHLIGGAFNFGRIKNNISILGTDFSVLSDMRYQGYAYGGGVAYGFAFMLSKSLNFELEGGFGYAFLDYDIFKCSGCGRKVGKGTHHYVGPTKAAVNLVYVF
ncbi:MAG: DUF3575 domain-containing protein [Tidjanibacter sp.]|jgi:long-subunit fatty acid transport protein|nr:DUF3575 domain-containing protein [Tidjanibacter sp.]